MFLGHEMNGKYENGIKIKKEHHLSRKSPKNGGINSNPVNKCF